MATLSIFLYGLTVLFFIGSGNATAVSDCPVPKPYQLKTPPLTTDWTTTVGISPWPEYPRPLLRRENWMNLNGPWQFKPAKDSQEIHSPPFGGCGFDSEILVPFPMESGLSGIMKNSMYSWYRKTFAVPVGWSGSNVLVNFGAVDYEGNSKTRFVYNSRNIAIYIVTELHLPPFANLTSMQPRYSSMERPLGSTEEDTSDLLWI
jgi:hypothetical protein